MDPYWFFGATWVLNMYFPVRIDFLTAVEYQLGVGILICILDTLSLHDNVTYCISLITTDKVLQVQSHILK